MATIDVLVTAVKAGDPPAICGPGGSRLGKWVVEGTVQGDAEGAAFADGARVTWDKTGRHPAPGERVRKDDAAVEALEE